MTSLQPVSKHLTLVMGQLSQWLANQPLQSYKHKAAETESSQKLADHAWIPCFENQQQFSVTDSTFCQRQLSEAPGMEVHGAMPTQGCLCKHTPTSWYLPLTSPHGPKLLFAGLFSIGETTTNYAQFFPSTYTADGGSWRGQWTAASLLKRNRGIASSILRSRHEWN